MVRSDRRGRFFPPARLVLIATSRLGNPSGEWIEGDGAPLHPLRAASWIFASIRASPRRASAGASMAPAMIAAPAKRSPQLGRRMTERGTLHSAGQVLRPSPHLWREILALARGACPISIPPCRLRNVQDLLFPAPFRSTPHPSFRFEVRRSEAISVPAD